jgi:hypothetical protein
MPENNIQELLAVHNTPALSITLPTNKRDKSRNREALKRAVRQANMLIDNSECSMEEKKKLKSNLAALMPQTPHAISEGFGIYVSPEISQMVLFPFSVKAKTVLADSFEGRDLVYLKDFVTPYLVLVLSRKSVRLFHGGINILHEIEDEYFPVALGDDYEYEKPSIGSSAEHSLKSFEKDKGILTNIRITSMLRKADIHLDSYLKERIYIILAGTTRIISAFRKITTHSAGISGEVHGSYSARNLHSLAVKSWECLKRSKLDEHAKLIQSLKEKNDGHLAKGVQESWEAVEEGKGFILAVEKDFHCHGFLVGSQVLLNRPKKPYEDIDDVIEELINRAARKNVRVMLMENNSLRDYDHVALQCRY